LESYKRKIVAVIPAYNEGKRIGEVITTTLRHVDEVIVVNDFSSDTTSEVSEKAGATVIDLPENKGAGYATKIGCEYAVKTGASMIVTIDGDGQHDPNDISKMIAALEHENLDVVFGGRPRNKNMPFENRVGNELISAISRLLFNVNIHDTLTGFHVFTSSAFDKLKWNSARYGFVSEIVVKVAEHKLLYAEVPIRTIYHDNKKGMRKRDGIKSLFLVLYWKMKLVLGNKK